MSTFLAHAPYLGYIGREATFKDGRVRILLRRNGKHLIMLRSRYRMEVKLGRVLLSVEQVDHKDEDYKNDAVGNLQVLSPLGNSVKRALLQTARAVRYTPQICSQCLAEFTHGKVKATCSLPCKKLLLGRKSTESGGKPPEIVEAIRRLRAAGGTSYSIASDLRIARNTVMRYW